MSEPTAEPATQPSPSTGWRLPETLAAFRYRDFRFLWMSMFASFTGMSMQMVARGWIAFELTHEHSSVGIVMMAWGIPQLLLSLLGGAIADRVDKRWLLMLSQTAIGVNALLTAIAISAGFISIPFLFAVGVVQGIVFAFNLPARQALLPEIVPQSGLVNAIALNNTAMTTTSIIAPAIAGVMMVALGPASVFYLQAALNTLVVILISRLNPSRSHMAGKATRGSVGTEIGIGLRFIWQSKPLRLLMLMAFAPTVLGMPHQALLPGFASDDLHLGEGAYGLLLTATGAGALVGSITIAALSGSSRTPAMQIVAGAGFGLALVLLALSAPVFGLAGVLASLALLGLASTSYMTLNNAQLMTHARPEYYGRVMSIYMITFGVFPLMAWPMGLLADAIGASRTFLLLGTAIFGFIVLVAASNPRRFFGPAQALAVPAAPPRPGIREAAPVAVEE